MGNSKQQQKGGGLDLRPFIKKVGLAKFAEQIELGAFIDTAGPKKIIDTLGPKKCIEILGVEQLSANLSPAERQRFKDLLG